MTITYCKVWEKPLATHEILCSKFYNGPYKESFPIQDETENPSIWLPRMSPGVDNHGPLVYIIIASSDEDVIGGIIFEFYRRSQSWLITYLAISEKYRTQGIGKQLALEALDSIRQLMGPSSLYIYSEVENPTKIVDRQLKIKAYERLQIMKRFGMKRLNFDYTQPPLEQGKNALETLWLLTLVKDENTDKISSGRLIEFLIEFYESFDPLPFYHTGMDQMIGSINAGARGIEAKDHVDLLPIPRLPAELDEYLGSAESFTVRLTFFSKHLDDVRTKVEPSGNQLYPTSTKQEYNQVNVHGEIPFNLVCEPELSKDEAHPFYHLTNKFASYHKDIVIPYASAGEVPLIIQGELIDKPRKIRIYFPHTMIMKWERENKEFPFTETSEYFEQDAYFVDSIAIFESGYIAYSVGLIFKDEVQGLITLNPSIILGLAATAKTAGEMKGQEIKYQFLSDLEERDLIKASDLNSFLRLRIDDLIKNNEGKGRVTAFSVFSGHKSESHIPPLNEQLKEKYRNMSFAKQKEKFGCDHTDLTSVSIAVEVIGSNVHDKIEEATKLAQIRRAPINNMTLRLAGLSQNVLDFQDQDASEIYDSLGDGHIFGSDIVFCQNSIAIRFSRSSRSYEDMWPFLGGEPYWFLVELVTAHNQKLVLDLNEGIREHQGVSGLSGRLLPQARESDELKEEQAKNLFEKVRLQVIKQSERRIRLAHYIPNIFRYPIERGLYENFTKSKSVLLQIENFHKIDNTIDQIAKDNIIVEKLYEDWLRIKEENARGKQEALQKKDDEKKNNFLLFIGIVQSIGVLAAFSSIFIALASLGQDDVVTFVNNWRNVLFHSDVSTSVSMILDGKATRDNMKPIWVLMPAIDIMFGSILFIVIGFIGIFPFQRFWSILKKKPFITITISAAVVWTVLIAPLFAMSLIIVGFLAAAPKLIKLSIKEKIGE